MTPAEISLMNAISSYLSPSWDQRDTYGEAAYHHACAGVQRAIAALAGSGFDPAAVARYTALLTGHPPHENWCNFALYGPENLCTCRGPAQGHAGEVVPNHIDNTGHVVAAFHPGDCITCHGHVGADGVFTPAQAAS